MDWNSAIHDV